MQLENCLSNASFNWRGVSCTENEFHSMDEKSLSDDGIKNGCMIDFLLSSANESKYFEKLHQCITT